MALTNFRTNMTSVKDANKKDWIQHPFRQSESTVMNHTEQHCRKELAKKKTSPKTEPIKFKLERSSSEVELHENEMAAEHRDYCMYCRVMGGKLSNTTTKGDSSVAPINASVTRMRHSYNKMVIEELFSTTSGFCSLVDATPGAELMDDDGSVDEIFELEL